jgi:hypothetical protein
VGMRRLSRNGARNSGKRTPPYPSPYRRLMDKSHRFMDFFPQTIRQVFGANQESGLEFEPSSSKRKIQIVEPNIHSAPRLKRIDSRPFD